MFPKRKNEIFISRGTHKNDVTDRSIEICKRLTFAGQFADNYMQTGHDGVKVVVHGEWSLMFRTVAEASKELTRFQGLGYAIEAWKKNRDPAILSRHDWVISSPFWPLFKEDKELVLTIQAAPDNAATVLREHNRKIADMTRYAQPVRRLQVA